MKKRVLSMLMALVLCLTLLPTAALADELGPVDGTSTVETAGADADDTEQGTASDDNYTPSESGGTAEVDKLPSPVQAMIDALPDALTEENAGDVSAMLGKIDAAMAALGDEERAALDLTQYQAVIAALAALAAAQGEIALYADESNKPKGEGTKASPYQITSTDELEWFRNTVNEGNAEICAELMDDLIFQEVNGWTWTPIGKDAGKAYTGTFNGNGYKITMKYAVAPGDMKAGWGLFGSIGNDGKVQDLEIYLSNFGWKGNAFSISESGMLAAYNSGTIERCTATSGKINVSNGVGLLVYQNNGTIQDCWTKLGTVIGGGNLIGGVAYTNNGKIKNCFFNGSYNSDYLNNHTIAFEKGKSGSIENCYFISGRKHTDNTVGVTGVEQADANSGKLTVKLNNNGNERGSKVDPWRIDSGSTNRYPSLKKTDRRVSYNSGQYEKGDPPHMHGNVEFTKVTALSDITADGNYYISGAIALDSTWEVDKKILLCLDGQTITAASGNVPAIKISSGGSLTLVDGSKNGGGKITGGATGVMLDGGAFTMQGGEISGNTVGVHVKSGDLTLGGKAKITDNPAADAGVKQNILLAANQKIRFDSLDPSAKFGISVEGQENLKDGERVAVTDTTGGRYFAQLVADGFKNDGSGFELYLSDDGNTVMLGKQSVHKHCICGDSSKNVNGHTHDAGITFLPWTETNKLPPSGNYYLTRNVTLAGNASPQGANVCLNGYTVTLPDVGRINPSGTTQLTDCSVDGKGKLESYPGKANGGVTISGGNQFCLYGGTLNGVKVEIGQTGGGTFNMYGGKITGNTKGTVVGQSKTSGNQSALIINMYGGEISGNHIVDQYGGGVFVGSGNQFNIYGGKIINNTTTADGGGVYIAPKDNAYQAGTMTICGDAVIQDNKANGVTNNVSLPRGSTIKIDGKMDASAQIGVTTNASLSAGTVTIATATDTGWVAAKNFTSDNSAYHVGLAKDGKNVTINAFGTTPAAEPNASFTATGRDAGTLVIGGTYTSTMQYSVDGGSVWNAVTSASMDITGVTAAKGIQVKDVGDGSTTSESPVKSITVTEGAKPTGLPVTQPSTIGGKGKIETTTSHEYNTDGGTTFTPCTGALDNLTAGTYHVRVKANGTELASETETYTITAFTATQETQPTATFTATGPDSGTLSGVDSGLKYQINSGAWTDIISNADVALTGLSACTINVVKKGDGTTTTDSAAQTITVTKATTPTGVTAVDCTAAGNDGKLQNVTNAMEYQKSGAAGWTGCGGTEVINLTPGTYLVRVKATGTTLASDNQSVTINASGTTPATYSVDITAGTGMTLTSGTASQTGLTGAMTEVVYTAGTDYYFPVGYSVASVNGVNVTRIDFTKIKVSGTPTANTTITLVGATAKTKEDTPTATFAATGPDSGTLSGVDSGLKYSVDGGTWVDITGDNMSITNVTTTNGVQVKKPATDSNTKLDSDVQTITVTKATTPTGVTAVGCTSSSNNDGKLENVTNLMEYQKSGAAGWTGCGGTEVINLTPGTYLVRVKATGTVLASDNQSVTINAYSSLPSETQPTATFTATGPNSGTLSNLVNGGEYAVTGAATTTFTASGTEHDLTGISAGTLSIVKKGNGTTTTDSTAQTITVTKASTPSTVTAVDCTAAGNDGKLKNVTTAMEYQKSGDSAWTDCGGTEVTGLTNGTYYVRVKATGTVLASDSQTVTINAFAGAQETTPAATFTATGPDSGKLSNLVSGGEYAVTGAATTTFTASGTEHDLTGISAGTLSIVKKGNGTTTTDSTAQTITVTKASTPSTVTAVDCTAAGNDGKLKNVTTAMEYQKSGDSAWTDCGGTEVTGLTNGTYYVRVKAAGTTLASDNQSVTINAYSSLPSETQPTATFTATGPDSGMLSGVDSGLKYQINSGAWTDITSNADVALTGLSACTINVVKKGNGTTTTDSPAQTITVTKAATPTGVTAVGCSTSSNNDGKLKNVTTAMEYQKSGAAAWTLGTGSDIVNLSDGTYLVRVKATGTVLASDNQTVVVAAYVAPTEYTITFDVNGGIGTIPSQTTSGRKLSSLPTAIHSGSYSFAGWYTAISSGTQITTTYTFSADTTVYAHWTYTGGGGGGGSYTPSYTVSVDKTENGTITVSPKSASKGDTVTITVKPDKGYELEMLKALDKDGDALKLTEKNGKYTFKMPSGKVTVKGSFVEEAPVQIFKDVPVDAYYYEAVKWAAEKGITGGVGNGLFAPNQPCTRAQIVTFLWRAAGSPDPKNMSSFADVPADAFYAKAVAWAVENGITGGTGDGKFSPDATCTRAQSVTFLYRAAGIPAVSGSAEFGDVATNAYYADAVAWAAKNGITGGIGGGLFGSGNDCTRAQIVTFLYRNYQSK